MPSFLKKLLLGKELSNPYVNKYHPGHRATPQPTQQVPNSAAQTMDSHPTSLNVSTTIPPSPISRPVSPTFLEEARRLAGRDPITGRELSPEQYPAYNAASSQMISQPGWGKPRPYTNEQMRYNPYITSGQTAVGGDGSQAVRERDRRTTVRTDVQQERHDVLVREDRRKAEMLSGRGAEGYFAPERSMREYYGQS